MKCFPLISQMTQLQYVCVVFMYNVAPSSVNWGYKQDLDIGQVSVSPGPVSNLQGHLQSSNFMTLMTKELTVSTGRTRKILRKIEEHQASSVYKSCCKALTETSTWKQSSFSSHGFNQQCLMFCDICHYCVQNYWWGNSIQWTRVEGSLLVKPESGVDTAMLVMWLCSVNKALSTHNHHHHTQLHSCPLRGNARYSVHESYHFFLCIKHF